MVPTVSVSGLHLIILTNGTRIQYKQYNSNWSICRAHILVQQLMKHPCDTTVVFIITEPTDFSIVKFIHVMEILMVPQL